MAECLHPAHWDTPLSLTTVLRPWLTGDQELNYKTFVDVLEWASAGFANHPSKGGT